MKMIILDMKGILILEVVLVNPDFGVFLMVLEVVVITMLLPMQKTQMEPTHTPQPFRVGIV